MWKIMSQKNEITFHYFDPVIFDFISRIYKGSFFMVWSGDIAHYNSAQVKAMCRGFEEISSPGTNRRTLRYLIRN